MTIRYASGHVVGVPISGGYVSLNETETSKLIEATASVVRGVLPIALFGGALLTLMSWMAGSGSQAEEEERPYQTVEKLIKAQRSHRLLREGKDLLEWFSSSFACLPLSGICVVTLKDGTRFHGISLDEKVSFTSSTSGPLLLPIRQIKAVVSDLDTCSLITVDGSKFVGVQFNPPLRFATPAGLMEVYAEQLLQMRGVTEDEADDLRYFLMSSLRKTSAESLTGLDRVAFVERFYVASPEDAPSKADEAFSQLPIPPASFRRFLKTFGLVPEDVGKRSRWRSMIHPNLFRNQLVALKNLPPALKEAWLYAADVEILLRHETRSLRRLLKDLLCATSDPNAQRDWMNRDQGTDLRPEAVNWADVSKGKVLDVMQSLQSLGVLRCTGTERCRQEWVNHLNQRQATAPHWMQTTDGRIAVGTMSVISTLFLVWLIAYHLHA